MKRAIIRAINSFSGAKTVSAGFDGYIDRIFKVRQHAAGSRHHIETMSQFGSYIVGKAGKSCSLELQQVGEKIGGNMPNYASALSHLGIAVNCIGTLGWPRIHPLFGDGLSRCNLSSVGQPGKCDALEFGDGKVMLTHNQNIDILDFETLDARIDVRAVSKLFTGGDLIAFFNWSEMKGATSIWSGLWDSIWEQLPKSLPMLVDFSDCSGRSPEEIREILQVLGGYQKACSVCYSMNLNEAEQFALKLGLCTGAPQELARTLYRQLQPEMVVIHLLNGCVYAGKEAQGYIPNKLIPNPILLTGAGDNFNAGLSFGMMLGLPIESALLLGNAVSGYYIFHGQSPDRTQLVNWLEQY